MALTWPPEVELLKQLVATPSVSGEEEAVAQLCVELVREWGLPVRLDDSGVTLSLESRQSGPTLALVSHLDVVPPGEGWTREPWSPHIDEGKLFGRGSGDAKASVAAMLCAARDVAYAGGPARGRLVVILGFGEETKNTSMPEAVARVGPVDAAIVGEPTNLNFAIAQRGLMMVDLVAHGDQRHAGYADADGSYENAALRLARDLVRLQGLCREREHPVLGHVTITPTMISGGVSRNVTPPTVKAVLDIRSTPDWSHDEIAAVLRAALESEVVVTSTRLVPCETPVNSSLLPILRATRAEGLSYGSPTCSDWVFLRDRDTIKCGPGTSLRSHRADECVDLFEVTRSEEHTV